MAWVPLNPPAEEVFDRLLDAQETVPARRVFWNRPVLLTYWHLMSLDAPTVAVVWAYAFAWAAHVQLPAWAATLLGLVVWAIYIIDRLLDARAGIRDPKTHSLQERHWFHWRHRRALGGMAILAAGSAAWMIARRLAAPALQRDSLMGLATLAYFSGVHGRGGRAVLRWRRIGQRVARCFPRELVVGTIFSAGCMLPVLPVTAQGALRVAAMLAPPALAFAVLAWLNVRAIGRWEADRSGLGKPAFAFAAVCAAGACSLARLQTHAALLLVAAAASALLLAGLDAGRERMDRVTLRAAADFVLLTPLLVSLADRLAR